MKLFCGIHYIIERRVERAPATGTLDSVLILGRINPKTINWYLQLPCTTFSIEENSVQPSLSVIYRWAIGSLTPTPKYPYAVSWPRQLGG